MIAFIHVDVQALEYLLFQHPVHALHLLGGFLYQAMQSSPVDFKAEFIEIFGYAFNGHGVDVSQLQDTGNKGTIEVGIKEGGAGNCPRINPFIQHIVVLPVNQLDEGKRPAFIGDALHCTKLCGFLPVKTGVVGINILHNRLHVKMFFPPGIVIAPFLQVYNGFCNYFLWNRFLRFIGQELA